MLCTRIIAFSLVQIITRQPAQHIGYQYPPRRLITLMLSTYNLLTLLFAANQPLLCVRARLRFTPSFPFFTEKKLYVTITLSKRAYMAEKNHQHPTQHTNLTASTK